LIIVFKNKHFPLFQKGNQDASSRGLPFSSIKTLTNQSLADS
jgi:hypothetical protein